MKNMKRAHLTLITLTVIYLPIIPTKLRDFVTIGRMSLYLNYRFKKHPLYPNPPWWTCHFRTKLRVRRLLESTSCTCD